MKRVIKCPDCTAESIYGDSSCSGCSEEINYGRTYKALIIGILAYLVIFGGISLAAFSSGGTIGGGIIFVVMCFLIFYVLKGKYAEINSQEAYSEGMLRFLFRQFQSKKTNEISQTGL